MKKELDEKMIAEKLEERMAASKKEAFDSLAGVKMNDSRRANAVRIVHAQMGAEWRILRDEFAETVAEKETVGEVVTRLYEERFGLFDRKTIDEMLFGKE